MKFDELENIKQTNYIVSQFILWVSRADYALMQLIRDIATAYLIASAVAFDGSDLEVVTSKFNGLEIYLDTPFVLRALGLNTDEMQVSYVQLMDELMLQNNTFKIFGHTYDEISNILLDCEHWIDNPRFEFKYASLALRTFLEKKYSKQDISLFIENLPQKLDDLGIYIDDTDYYQGVYNIFQIDEEAITESIETLYKQSNPNFNEEAKKYVIQFDVRSIASMFKLWKNKAHRSYAKAGSIFVTTNSTLAFSCRKLANTINPSCRYNVYPCITDIVLGTNIWLHSPVQKIENFSETKLMADCMASIQPSDHMLTLLQKSIETLRGNNKISDKDYYLLRARGFNNHYLQHRTLNDELAFSDKITEEILEDLKNEIAAPHKAHIETLTIELEDSRKSKNEIEQQLQQKIDKERRAEEQEHMLEKDFENRAKKKVENLINILLPVFFASLALTIVFSLNLMPLPNSLTQFLKILAGVVSFLSAISTVLLRNDIKGIKSFLISTEIRRLKIKDFKNKYSLTR